MTKEVKDFLIQDLMGMVQSVDRVIQVYVQTGVDGAALFMIRQYCIRREEFVERLDHIRNKPVKESAQLKPITVPKMGYAHEPIEASVAHEPARPYGIKSNLTLIEGISPQIEELLNQSGISTFDDLAFMPVSKLKKILKVKGQRLIMQNLETCSLRAKLAADGHWEGLRQLQELWN
jgi:predicted flap endonuclease-1-like 5' DNA nuclease